MKPSRYTVTLNHDDRMRVMEWGCHFVKCADPNSYAAMAVLERTPGLEEDIRTQLQTQV